VAPDPGGLARRLNHQYRILLPIGVLQNWAIQVQLITQNQDEITGRLTALCAFSRWGFFAHKTS
jgi:hypothetical protein